MANDAEIGGGLPRWPTTAKEMPADAPSAGPHYDGWLVAVAIAYPIIGFGILLLGGGNTGPAGFGFEVIAVPPLVLIAGVVGARLDGAPLRWASVVAFVGWVLLVALLHYEIWVSAIAAV